MADEEQLAILKQGVAAWNEWRKKETNGGPQRGGPQRGETHQPDFRAFQGCEETYQI
jgi:hypothetical protein